MPRGGGLALLRVQRRSCRYTRFRNSGMIREARPIAVEIRSE
jgi:hypothetical protein